MHLALCSSRQLIEVANIFSALRVHQRHKTLIRKAFSIFVYSHIVTRSECYYPQVFSVSSHALSTGSS
jgi:hypothetical protein